MSRKNVNVILVGSNPLPCYIQAAYVLQGVTEEEEAWGLKRPDLILFVATNETGKYVENIKRILAERKKKDALHEVSYDQMIIEDLYNSAKIEKEIKDKLVEIQKMNTIGHILLNNTGGTKTMAVYATAAIRDFAKAAINVTECFVDPQKNKLRCYCRKQGRIQDDTINFPKNGDLRSKVQLEIKELVSLHYGKIEVKFKDLNGKNKKGKDYEALTETQCAFAKTIIEQKDVYEFYDEFLSKCIKEEKKVGSVNKLQILSEEEVYKEYFEKLKPYFLKESQVWTPEAFKQFLVFMRGDWFEQYFYEILLDVKKELETKNILLQTAWSFEVTPQEEDSKNFEVDVLTLYGYQLILYSISMAGDNGSENLAKGKWFEAAYRVEQMAGEHGKVIIVNFLPDDEQVLTRFQNDLQSFNREVKTIHRSMLKNIEEVKDELKTMLV